MVSHGGTSPAMLKYPDHLARSLYHSIILSCACAVTSDGGAYGSWAALVAILMLLKGIYEHRKFRALAARLQAQRTVEE